MKRASFACLFLIAVVATTAAQNNAVPSIDQSLTPVSAAPGRGSFTLYVTGVNFAPNAALYWNGSVRVTIVNSSRSLQAVITANDVSRAGTAAISVVNPAPGGGKSNVVFFPIHASDAGVAIVSSPVVNKYGTNLVADFNNDGIPDLAIGQDGTIYVYLGKPDGTFKKPITSTGFYTDQLLAADFNGDGNLDLAMTEFNDEEENFTGVALGDGKGNFTATKDFFLGTVGAVGDWNRDGKMDMTIWQSDCCSASTSIYLGNGDGTFTAGQISLSYAGNEAVGDFNGDGIADLALSRETIVLGNGDGTFQDPPIYNNGDYGAIQVADLNGDGILDIVCSAVTVYLGKGDGTFTNIGGPKGNYYSVTLADVNNDGKLDLLLATNPGLSVALGNGDGSFQTPFQLSNSYIYGPPAFAIADFNRDGKLDIVTQNQSNDNPIFLQTSASVSTTTLAFPAQTVGTSSSPLSATFSNVSSSNLPIQSITITGSSYFSQTNTCGSQVPANSSCTISVIFTPLAQGYGSARLAIAFQGVGSPFGITLYGSGVPGPTLTISPNGLMFPMQLIGTSSLKQKVTLTNNATLEVDISSIAISGAFLQTNNCPAILYGYGNTCQIEVQFKPVVTGQATGAITITDNAAFSPQTINLFGIGTEVKFSATGINFGNQKVGTSSFIIPVTMTNIGTTSLFIGQIAITGVNAGDFSESDNCFSSLPAGASCSIGLKFTPTATGSRSASLSVTDTGGGSPQTVTLSGNGT
jgi:hypothetical protein